MIVAGNKEDENQHSLKNHHQCMVLGAGLAPISKHFSIGMEHDKSLGVYGGFLQDTSHQSSNGVSDLIGDSRSFDDDAEIEAAAAQSETPMPIVLSGPTSSLKPLHVQVNGFNGSASEASTISASTISASRASHVESSSTSYFSSLQQPKGSQSRNQSPMVKDWFLQKASTSSNSSNIVMGPPSTSSTVLLSPAGNIQNGSTRSSGDMSPLSPAAFFQRAQSKRETFVHPLATTSTSSSSGTPYSRPTSQHNHRLGAGFHSTTNQSTVPISPQNQRKEIELSKRRIVCDKLHRLRENKSIVGFLSHTESQTDTQLAMLLRKSRGEFGRDLPIAIRNEVFDEKTDEKTQLSFITKRLKDSNVLRVRDNDPDEVTDISEDDEEMETVAKRVRNNQLTAVSVSSEKVQWNEQKMRIGVQMAKNNLLIAEKKASLEALNKEIYLIGVTSGCRFEGEECQPRKRRIVDGNIQLFDTSPFVRSSTEEWGCARARPIVSWTKRALKKHIFQDYNDGSVFDPSVPGCSLIDEKFKTYDNKKIATGSNEVVTMLTFGDNRKREITEYDYKSYEEGKGLVQLSNFSDNNVVDFVTSKDYRPIENRILSFLHRLSMAPAMTVRKSINRSICMESGKDEKKRNGAIRLMNVKEKRDNKEKKREKRHEEMSSDEEDWIPPHDSSRRSSTTKRARGRPSKPPKKAPRKTVARSTSNATRNNNKDYGLDDYYMDDPCPVISLPKWHYAHIELPHWYKIDPIKADKNEAEPDSLWNDVAKNHHQLMYLERERVKRQIEKKNRQSNKIAAMSKTPGSLTPVGKDDNEKLEEEDEKDIKEEMPPFDPKQFEPTEICNSVRRFASVEKPYDKREFRLKK